MSNRAAANAPVHALSVSSPVLFSGYVEDDGTLHRPVDGEGFFRTGDIFAEDADGELRYLGRMDRRLNWRGYRIEVQEIELLAYGESEVRDARAVVDRRGDLVLELDGEVSDQTLERVSLRARDLLPSSYAEELVIRRAERLAISMVKLR